MLPFEYASEIKATAKIIAPLCNSLGCSLKVITYELVSVGMSGWQNSSGMLSDYVRTAASLWPDCSKQVSKQPH